MTPTIPILEDEDREWPIPSEWRPTLRTIANALKDGNYSLRGLGRVEQLDDDTAAAIADNIRAYGETLCELPDASWDTSVCQWQVEYWELLVDLFTIESGRSDLVAHIKVFEDDQGFTFKVHLVYVP